MNCLPEPYRTWDEFMLAILRKMDEPKPPKDPATWRAMKAILDGNRTFPIGKHSIDHGTQTTKI
jgi:hypothetical protein